MDQAENYFPVSGGFGCHMIRYSESVCLDHGLGQGFGVPNHMAPSAWSKTREVILSPFLRDDGSDVMDRVGKPWIAYGHAGPGAVSKIPR